MPHLIRILMLLVLLIVTACGTVPSASPGASRTAPTAALEDTGQGTPAPVGAPSIVVYKSPTCSCCTSWNEHLEAHGFSVTVEHVDDLTAVKDRHGVPATARSCHTAIVDGYVVEGHVPAAEIRRLLAERPAIVGLAVAGMPAGSPGMEGGAAQPYDVLSFDASGATSVFAQYGR
jgi:hypothetical protein